MALPVLPGVVRVSAAGVVAGGGRWQNTWHIRKTSGVDWTESELVGLNDIFKQIYVGPGIGAGLPWVAHKHETSQVDQFAYTPLNGISGAVIFVQAPIAGAATPSMPSECSPVLTLRTAARGRQNRGRIYFPAPNTSWNTAEGRIVQGFIDDIVNQVVGVHNALIASGAALGVGSYGPYKNPVTHVLEPGTPHFTPCISYTMDDRWDVQRGRKT